MPIENAPTLTINHAESGAAQTVVVASGIWQVHALAESGVIKSLTATLASLKDKAAEWDLSQLTSLDHIGAQ
ncbi:MAG: ABC transporter permease, partial [Telluria sp.]